MSEEMGGSAREVLEQAGSKNAEFSGLLDKIDYATNETKKLWREVYENAVEDRAHAYLLFVDLYRNVIDSEKGHFDYGKLLTMYMERMNRSNDQLLKLAEMVASAEHDSGEIDAESLYKEIDGH